MCFEISGVMPEENKFSKVNFIVVYSQLSNAVTFEVEIEREGGGGRGGEGETER